MGVPRAALRVTAYAVVVVIAVSAVVSLRQLSNAGGELAKPQEAGRAIGSLRCPTGDPILEMESLLGKDRKGGSKKAFDALGAFLRAKYPGLDAGDFHRVASAKGAVQFAYAESGKRRATAYVRHRGDSWHVLSFAACDSVLANR